MLRLEGVVRCGGCDGGSLGRTIADVFDLTLGFTIMKGANGTTVRERVESHFVEGYRNILFFEESLV